MRPLRLLLAGLICAGSMSALAAAPEPGSCVAGYEAAGNDCRLALPPHATRNPAGDWICDRGTYEADGQCLPVEVPAHARLSAAGRTWVCDDGYHDAGSACRPGPAPQQEPAPSARRGPVPAHARRVLGSDFWLCQPGYQRFGDKCAPVHIPRFAHLSVSRDDWLCNRGYQREANRCIEIDVPDHASLGYYGDAWFCNRGYYEIRGVCLPETDEHRAMVARYDSKLRMPPPIAQAPPRSIAASRGDHGLLTFAGIVVAVALATFTLFNTRQMPRPPARHLTMAYVPRRRGSGSAVAVWRSFGHRVDALTGAPIANDAKVAQCRNCQAWYDAASVGALRHENEARCVACGRAAVRYRSG
jgi:hypothetical protein